MAATLVEIFNRALTKIGETEFLTVSTGNTSIAGKTCELHWADIRDEVLSDFPWPFANRQKAIVVDATESRTGWEYAFTLPTDFLMARFLHTQDTRIALVAPESRDAYEIALNEDGDGKLLFCDYAAADIQALEYTAQVTDVTLYSAAFCDAVSWRLAVELALALPKDERKAGAALQMYKQKILEAFAQQLRGNREDHEPLEGSGIRARE